MKELKYILSQYFDNNEAPGDFYHQKMSPSSRNPMQVKHDHEPRSSAVLILLFLKQEAWHIALIKRNAYKGSHSKQISFPGGKVEEQDQSLMETALRETHEEIGVHVPKESVVGQLTDLHIPISNFVVSPFVAVSQEQANFKIDKHEVDYLIELPIENILHPQHIGQRRIKSEDHEINTPVYEVNDNYIWGATAMILAEFSEVLKRVGYK